MNRPLALLSIALIAGVSWAGEVPPLALPARPANALTGTELARVLRDLDLRQREERLFTEIAAGNVPDFLRALKPVAVTNMLSGLLRELIFHVTPDYLAVGCDTDFLRIPLTPMTAQRLADRMDCSLPTAALVDAIWRAADVKLAPQPVKPGPEMTTLTAFTGQQRLIEQQLGARRGLVAGHKKDVVLAPNLTNQVAIYGWHQTNGQPIQPLYTRHSSTWTDYSHGVRLIANEVMLNGQPGRLADFVTNAPRYSTNWPATEFRRPGSFREVETNFNLSPDVRVRLNLPPPAPATTKTVLVIFALPNGNTIEQTAGRRPHGTNEWRFDIQHIAAQTRFVRAALPGTRLALAYVEAAGLSWPAWRKQHGNAALPRLVGAIQSAVTTNECSLILSGHSGGGSFIFGYLDAVTNLPTNLQQLIWLDAYYAYSPTDEVPLVRWLKAADHHRLSVFAYHDSVALLNGKTFVSSTGGTWGRSLAMLTDLEKTFTFTRTTNGPLRTVHALDGRVEFQLRENPERKIWHTVLVERNGFIHALLAGTPAAGQGYEYLGPRAYEKFITAD